MHEAARVRVEGPWIAMEQIAIELGIRRQTLLEWRKRFGWRRPAPPAGPSPGYYRSRRFGRPYAADAVGVARDLVTGSDLPMGRIAARAGVDRATVYRWAERRGWTRPPSATRRRCRPPYGPAVVAAARALYEATELSTRIIAARAGTTRERVASWARTGGWTRLRDGPDPQGRVRRGRGRHALSSPAARRAGKGIQPSPDVALPWVPFPSGGSAASGRG